jgi:hypothetical protein
MSITGTYEGRVNAPIGATPITLVLKEEGTLLTGAVLSRKGEEAPISDGQINGEEFSFSFEMNMALGKSTVQFRASVDGDDLNGFLTTPLGTVSVTAKRV